jgi:hypothetical protein
VVIDEFNAFIWPGPDIAALERADDRFFFGHLPSRVTRQIIDGVRDNLRRRNLRVVKRDR